VNGAESTCFSLPTATESSCATTKTSCGMYQFAAVNVRTSAGRIDEPTRKASGSAPRAASSALGSVGAMLM